MVPPTSSRGLGVPLPTSSPYESDDLTTFPHLRADLHHTHHRTCYSYWLCPAVPSAVIVAVARSFPVPRLQVFLCSSSSSCCCWWTWHYVGRSGFVPRALMFDLWVLSLQPGRAENAHAA